MDTKTRIHQIAADKAGIIADMKHSVWGFAEYGYKEFKSAAKLTQVLEDEGFQVERGIAGIETAFVGTYGSGKPVIGILGGMLGVLVFGKRIQMGVLKARSKNGMIGALLTGVLSLAIIEAFLPMQLIKGPVFCAVALTSCLATVAQMMLVKKFKILWYRNFIMAVTLIVGMASSLIWVQVLG